MCITEPEFLGSQRYSVFFSQRNFRVYRRTGRQKEEMGNATKTTGETVSLILY